MRTVRHRGVRVTLVFCFVLSSMMLVSTTSIAQEKKEESSEQSTPSPVTTAVSTPAQPTTTATTAPSPAAKPATTTAANGSQPSTSGTDEQLVVNADLITLTVTVTNSYDRYISGLSKSAFTIYDNKVPQEIIFFSDDDAPVSVGVVFDVSGSMGRDKVARAREALRRFIETSHDGDEYFLIGFNSRAQLLMDRTRNSDAVLDKLTFVQTKGTTALYDACYLGVEKVTRGTHQKRAVLVISDGQDNSSRYTFSELRRMLKESNVVIYAVGILDSSDMGSGLGMAGQAILDEIASVSGGKAFFPTTAAEMNEIFERIAIELRHQYSIGYRPSNFVNDGKWRKIKVKVTPPRGLPKLFVRSREGYYATTNPR